MANQLDLGKLFKEKFETFELDNSANIELALKKKLQTAKLWNVFKWISGIVVLTGLSLLVLLPKQWDDDSSQNILKESAVELIIEKEEVIIENVDELDQLEETTLIKDDSHIEAQVIEHNKEDAVLVNEEVEIEEQSLDIEKEETELVEIAQVKNKLPIIIKTHEPESLNLENKNINYLVPKYSLILLEEYEAASINKTSLELHPISIAEEPKTKNKKKLHLPNEVEPLPYGGLGNMMAYGEINAMPFLFHNREASTLPTSDTVSWSQVKENAQVSYQLGLAFRLQKKDKPWFLQTGINYQSFKENVDYKFNREYIDHELSFWDYDSIFEYHIDPPNFDTVLVDVDSNYMEHWVKTENAKTNINTYTYLNIPFMVGYHFKKGRSPFSLQVSTGISLSVLLKNTGYLYNDYGQIVNYTSAEIKPIITWNLLLNATVNYQLKNENTLFVRPSFQYQVGKSDVLDQPLQRKYFVYGLSFGYRINIF